MSSCSSMVLLCLRWLSNTVSGYCYPLQFDVQIMTCLIVEGDDVPQQLLDTVLDGLVSENPTVARSVADGKA